MMASPDSVLVNNVFKAARAPSYNIVYDVNDDTKSKMVVKIGTSFDFDGDLDAAIAKVNDLLIEFRQEKLCSEHLRMVKTSWLRHILRNTECQFVLKIMLVCGTS